MTVWSTFLWWEFIALLLQSPTWKGSDTSSALSKFSRLGGLAHGSTAAGASWKKLKTFLEHSRLVWAFGRPRPSHEGPRAWNPEGQESWLRLCRRIGKVLRHQSDKLGSWIESSRAGRGLCFSGADAATLLRVFVVEIGLHVTAMFYQLSSFSLASPWCNQSNPYRWGLSRSASSRRVKLPFPLVQRSMHSRRCRSMTAVFWRLGWERCDLTCNEPTSITSNAMIMSVSLFTLRKLLKEGKRMEQETWHLYLFRGTITEIRWDRCYWAAWNCSASLPHQYSVCKVILVQGLGRNSSHVGPVWVGESEVIEVGPVAVNPVAPRFAEFVYPLEQCHYRRGDRWLTLAEVSKASIFVDFVGRKYAFWIMTHWHALHDCSDF